MSSPLKGRAKSSRGYAANTFPEEVTFAARFRLHEISRCLITDHCPPGSQLKLATRGTHEGLDLVSRVEHVLQRSAVAYDKAIRGNLDDVAPS